MRQKTDLLADTAEAASADELSRLFLFQGLTREELCSLVSQITPQKHCFEAGASLTAGRTEKALIFLLSGEATVMRRGENEVLLNRLYAGDCFGATTMFGDACECPTAVTAVKKTRCLFLTEKDLRHAIEQHPTVAISYITFLSKKIRFLNQRMTDFSAKNAEAKLASYLLSHEENGIVSIKNLSKAAKELSLGRASFYRSMASLEASGAVMRSGSTITLIQKNILERIKEK